MYNPTSSKPQVKTESPLDSKYTVAEILSSMKAPITPVSFSSGAAPSYPTSTESLLTPSTIASLERSFELAGQTQNSDQISGTESGFVPPVVNPIVIDPAISNSNMGVKREYDQWDDELSSCSSTDPEWNPATGKRMKTENHVSNIDPQTYLMTNSRRPTGPRKERRNDQLPQEEQTKRNVRRERNKMAAAKCRQRRVDQTNTLINETENLEEEKALLETEIQSLQQQKDQLQFLLEAHKPSCKHMHHQTSMSTPAIMSHTQSRPSSLPLRINQPQSSMVTTSNTIGVPISTPSSGVFSQFGLDAILEGHTGLTPLTSGPSCSSQVQQHRSSSDSSSSEMGSPKSTLISL